MKSEKYMSHFSCENTNLYFSFYYFSFFTYQMQLYYVHIR